MMYKSHEELLIYSFLFYTLQHSMTDKSCESSYQIKHETWDHLPRNVNYVVVYVPFSVCFC